MKSGNEGNIQAGFHDNPRQLTREDYAVMHLPVAHWKVRRKAIPPQSRLREVLDRFICDVPRFMKARDPSLVLLHGRSNTGKTGAAVIMARAARAHRFTVFYLDASSLLKSFMDDGFTADGETTAKERSYLTDVLVLDGVGNGYSSNEFVLSEITALLRHRQDNGMLTIVTTQLDGAALDKIFGREFRPMLDRNSVNISCMVTINPDKTHES